jgi:hypothetical protein
MVDFYGILPPTSNIQWAFYTYSWLPMVNDHAYQYDEKTTYLSGIAFFSLRLRGFRLG